MSDIMVRYFSKNKGSVRLIIQQPNIIAINITTFIHNWGKIREQLAGVDFHNSFSNNNEIWEGYFIQSSYLTQFNIFNAISLLPKACQKP